MSSYDYSFKVLLFGEVGKIKTAFTKRYCYNIFNPSERLTIGVDFHVKTVTSNGKKVKLQIWDVGGEKRFRFLLPTYCLGANAAFLLYDITRSQSLDNVSEWVNILRQKAGEIPIGLVGMRVHKEKQRTVSRERGIEVAEKAGLNFYGEASAKTGQNINLLFEAIIDLILETNESPSRDRIIRTLTTPSPSTFKQKSEVIFKFDQSINNIILDSSVIEELNEEITKLMEKFEEWEFFAILSNGKQEILKGWKVHLGRGFKKFKRYFKNTVKK